MLEREQAVHVDRAAAGRQRAACSKTVDIGHDGESSRENLIVPRPRCANRLALRLSRKKLGNDARDVSVLDVRRVIQLSHIRSSDFSAKLFERPAYLRITQQRLRPRDRCGSVRWE